MWNLVKLILKGTVAILLLGTVATLWLFARGGAFQSLEPHFAGSCETLPLTGSSEDIQPDRERNMVYLSLLDRRGLVRGENVEGDVLRVDLNDRVLTAVPALQQRPENFRPHGMSLYVDTAGQRHLFVINDSVDRELEPPKIELFREVDPGSFAHVRTFTHEYIHSPNDIVAVGPEQFYVANDSVFGGTLAGALQQFGIGGSLLTWVDGDHAEIIADNIALGGGISASNDLRRIYVAETTGMRLRVLERTGTDGQTREISRIPLGTSPDNIDVAPDDSLWIGAHPNVLALIRHFAREEPAPSQVLRVELPDGGEPIIEEIYLNEGDEISASSSGVSIDGRLLIGSITERRILVCEMD